MNRAIIAVALVILFAMPLATSTSATVQNNNIVVTQEGEGITIDTNATLRLALGYYLDILNPVMSGTAYDWDVLGLLFDSLYTPNPVDYFNLSADIPWMVTEFPTFETKFDASLNRTIGIWTIHLRDDIYFFDGVKLTADDLIFTYDLINWMGDMNDPWYDVWLVVINATKIDDYTVKVYVDAQGLIAARYALGVIVFPKHIYEKEETWGVTDEDTFDVFPNWNVTPDIIASYEAKSPTDPILTGYGPFKLIAWSPADKPVSEATSFLLERNPKYFMRAVDEKGKIIVPWEPISEEHVDLHGPYIRYIEYKVIIMPEDLKNALLAGDIDMAAELEFGRYVPEFTRAGFTVASSMRLGFGHTFINCRSPEPAIGENVSLLSLAAFRRALAYAYDKRAVCERVWYGWAEPIDIPVPKAMGRWSIEHPDVALAPGSYADHDREKALAELKKLGIEDYDNDSWLEWNPNDPDSEITIRIEGTDIPDVREIVGVIAEGVEDVGIHVDQLFVDFHTLLDHLFTGEYQLAFFGFGLGRIPTFLEVFCSWGWGYWLGGWHNDTYDSLLYQAFYIETDIDKIMELVWEAEIIYWYELPLIPIYQNIIVGAYKKWTPETPEGWLGVWEYHVGAPVVNWYTIMKVVKPTGIARPIPTITWVAIAIAVIVIIVAVAVILKRKPAE